MVNGRRREEQRAPKEERIRDLLLYVKRCNRRGALENSRKSLRRINKLLSRMAQKNNGGESSDYS